MMDVYPVDPKKYNLSLRFSRSFDKNIDPRDVVHDCYIKWRKYYDRDLFEEDPVRIYVAVKQYFGILWKAKSFAQKGTSMKLPKSEISLSDTYPDGDPVYNFPNNESIEDNYIRDELDAYFQKTVTAKLMLNKHGNNRVDYNAAYELMKQGCGHSEIQEAMGLSRSTTTETIRYIRETLVEVYERR